MDAPHRRLAATLRQRILDGTYPPGSKFPTVRAIAAEHGVGLGTSYQAVAILRRAGDLVGEPRKRLEVAHPVGVRTLADPDAQWPHEQALHDRTRPRASEDLATRLGIKPGLTVTRERWELLDPDGRPAILLTTWRRGRARGHGSYRLSVRTHSMTREEGGILGFPTGTPALLVERARLDAAGSVVEVADLVLPADRWTVGM